MSNVDRREFLKLVGAGGVGAGAGFMLAESIKHPVEFLVPYPVPPEEFSPGIATWYNSVCGMCPAGCGISVRTREGRAKKIEGNPAHPVSQGRLCALGQAGLQVLYNPDRLTGPLELAGERGSGEFEETTWEEGLSAVASQLELLRDAGRATNIWFVSEGVRGHLAMLFETFMSGLGSPNLLHYDFAYPATLYTANRRFFGEQRLPYYDIANAHYLLSFGADYLNNWLSPVHHRLGFGRSRHADPEHRGHFVQIEPKISLSGAAADEWVPARPGSESRLALAIAERLVSEGNYAGDDADAWATALEPYAASQAAEATGVAADTIHRLAEEFAHAGRALAIGGGAAANHTNGVETLVAVNALNYLAGNIGQTGGVVFNPAPVAGPSALTRRASYADMVDLAENARRGLVDVLIINNTDPVFTLPTSVAFAEALEEIPLIVSLSSFIDDTSRFADVVLPSHSYLESWGDDVPEPGVGFSVGAVSQPVVAPLYNTKATGDIVIELAARLGMGETIPWPNMEECIRDGWRAIFERSAPAQAAVDAFDSFWREILQAGVWGENVRRDAAFTLDPDVIGNVGASDAEFAGDAGEFPFILHPYLATSMYDGRGANLPWMQELPDPITSVVYGSWVELNPTTAESLGLAEGDLVEVRSTSGTIRAPVVLFPGIMPDVVAMPIGQGHGAFGRYASNRGVNPIEILAPETTAGADSLAWGGTRVALAATGRHARLVKTSGVSRQLGRDIVQTTGAAAGTAGHSAKLSSIPITVEPA